MQANGLSRNGVRIVVVAGAPQRDVRSWGISGSARLALETTLMTVRPEGANYQ
jgi:hypothetical protein